LDHSFIEENRCDFLSEKGVLKTRNWYQSFKELLFPHKIKIFILAKLGDTLKIVESAKAKSTVMKFSRKDRDYVLQLDKAILDKDNTPVLFYYVDDTNPLTLTSDKIVTDKNKIIRFNPRDVSVIMKTKKLQNKLGSQEQMLYWVIIAGLIIGVIAISVYSLQIQQQLIKEIETLKQLLRGFTFS
jgi:hypothetical protein